ncbi:hypothetical protein BGZ91_003916 [Linnemannia elongata]|nr:hypothetical protein BGZ91_003916 [Linnemannia elongata]KAG0059645.1 hypothetical protein BGZ90_004388 [Linnemannia elongata]
MSHAPNPTTPDVDIDIHTALRLMQEQMQQQEAFMQQQQRLLQQQQDRIQQLESSNLKRGGKVVCKNTGATILELYQELLDVYPAIGEPKFFDSELPKNHEVFTWDDFHYTEGMDYKPPSVLQHSEVTLSDTGKRHERDLIAIQGYLAHTTRFYDTFAHEVIKSGVSDSALGKRTLDFLNTVRISTAHDASRITRMRENLYLDELGIKHKEESLFNLESLAAKKAAADPYEPPKDKTKKPDDKSNKDKSGYKCDNDKSGYKSD